MANSISAQPHGSLHACQGPAAAHNPHCSESQLNVDTSNSTPEPQETVMPIPQLEETKIPQPSVDIKTPALITPITLVALPNKLMSIKAKNVKKHKEAVETFLTSHASKKIHKTVNTDNLNVLLIPDIHKEVSKWKLTETNSTKKPYPVTVYHIKKYDRNKHKIKSDSNMHKTKSKQKVKSYTSQTAPTAIIQTNNGNKAPMKVHKHTVAIHIDAAEYYQINKYEGILLSEHIDTVAPNDGVHTLNTSIFVEFVYKF